MSKCSKSEIRKMHAMHPTCTNWPDARLPTYRQARRRQETNGAPDASAGAIRTSAAKEPGARQEDAPGALPCRGSQASAGFSCTRPVYASLLHPAMHGGIASALRTALSEEPPL